MASKWVVKGVAVLVAAVIVAVAVTMFQPGVDAANDALNDGAATNGAATVDNGVGSPSADTSTTSAPEWHNVREPVLDEMLDFQALPHVETFELSEGRYRISYAADNLVKFVVYNQDRYNDWRTSGVHTLSKASTQKGGYCCSVGETFLIDINTGESGTYYLVFDQDKLADDQVATSSGLTVTKING